MTMPLVYSPSPIRIVPASRSIPLRAGGVAIAKPIQSPNTLELPPQLYPPWNAIAFNLAANTPITGVNAQFQPAGLQLDIPDNCYGAINQIDLLLDGILPTSNVFWRLLINGNPLPGWNALTILARSGAASVNRGWGPQLGIQVPLGGTVGMQISDVDGASYTAGAQIYGWFWPQER